jgi:arginyl-tRNA synthetase
MPSVEEKIRGLLPWHQRFIDEDPRGTRYFTPYMEHDPLELDQLERIYQFVSETTDSEAARTALLTHPQHGTRSLAELPRLITTFIQNPKQHEQERLAWEKARAATLQSCSRMYRRLGVQLADPAVQGEPLERGESFYSPFLPDVVSELQSKGLAVESDGAQVVHVPGHENPLIVRKADGSYLYGTTDLAALRFRVRELGADRILYFVDARQSQHFAQVFWTARAAGWAENVSLEHAAFGTMLGADKRPFKTRSGDVVKLKDLLDEAEERAAAVMKEKSPELAEENRRKIAHAIGIGAIKYADLSKDRVSDYIFSWEQMLSFEGNTAPYLQNAYVRISSIFRKAGAEPRPPAAVALDTPHEQALAKHLLRFGEVVELVARELKPHHLCTYLYDLAAKFHGFYEHCPVIQSGEPMRSSRLALCQVTQRTLGQGLDLLGIEHPEQM